MSHNDNVPERAARRHMPAIVAILAALALAGVALIVFGGGGRDEPVQGELAPATGDAGTSTTTVPATTTSPATTAPATAPASN